MLEEYDMASAEHLNRLYVGLTRARTRLVLMHGKTLPSGLEGVITLFNRLKDSYESGK